MTEYPKDVGVPLEHYRDVHDCCISIHCLDCQGFNFYRAADVIDQLERRGIAGAKVGVIELQRHVQGVCARCGGRRWECRPDMDMKEPGVSAFAIRQSTGIRRP